MRLILPSQGHKYQGVKVWTLTRVARADNGSNNIFNYNINIKKGHMNQKYRVQYQPKTSSMKRVTQCKRHRKDESKRAKMESTLH